MTDKKKYARQVTLNRYEDGYRLGLSCADHIHSVIGKSLRTDSIIHKGDIILAVDGIICYAGHHCCSLIKKSGDTVELIILTDYPPNEELPNYNTL